jgi:hypothetical protein
MDFRSRWYSPELGRFLSPDPAGYIDGPNLYQAFLGNPVNFSDPYGLCIGIDELDCLEVLESWGDRGATFDRAARFYGHYWEGAALAIPRLVGSLYQVVRHPIQTRDGIRRGADVLGEQIGENGVGAVAETAWEGVVNADPNSIAEVSGEVVGLFGTASYLKGVQAARAARLAVPAEATTAAVVGEAEASAAARGVALVKYDPAFAAAWLGRGPLFSHPEAIAAGRAEALQSALTPATRGRVTMGAAVVEDGSGMRRVVISTSEPRGYIRPTVRPAILPGERVIVGGGHAEVDIISAAGATGDTVIAVGAGRRVCTSCATAIESVGARVASPRRARGPR